MYIEKNRVVKNTLARQTQKLWHKKTSIDNVIGNL